MLYEVLIPDRIDNYRYQSGNGLTCAIIDMDDFIKNIAFFVINLICLAKYINFAYNLKQLLSIYEIIENQKQYFLLCCLIASVYGAMIPFMLVPTLLNVFNALEILNMIDD
ncbi:odorant receptor 49a-like [Vespula maculifrons]|uniref:Odorant receptor 49a-like n=1 Tax=Vespula maculifrons TaxID=7453 RepID=A0ABD2B435_VESMC